MEGLGEAARRVWQGRVPALPLHGSLSPPWPLRRNFSPVKRCFLVGLTRRASTAFENPLRGHASRRADAH